MNRWYQFQRWFRETTFHRWINKPGVFIGPYIFLFVLIILFPTIISGVLSFTYFNTIEFPKWVGFDNYINLFTTDSIFLQSAIPNTFFYAIIVGTLGYVLSFTLAWMLAQVTPKLRTLYTLAIYSPSITGPVMMSVIWQVVFSGDQRGYINNALLELNLIDDPIQFLVNPEYLFPIVLIIGLWSSAGLGFLAMLAGIINIDPTLYEAAAIDGIRNRWQEIFYITIPSMKPQMLFGAVMAIVGAFNVSGVATALSGGQYPPQNAGWMIIDHANDFGFFRYEMGYASAVTVVLFFGIIFLNMISYKLFGDKN
jgi:multiple sugar transport system permease protein